MQRTMRTGRPRKRTRSEKTDRLHDGVHGRLRNRAPRPRARYFVFVAEIAAVTAGPEHFWIFMSEAGRGRGGLRLPPPAFRTNVAPKRAGDGRLSAETRGSMHGEIGQTQFLPKTVLQYGVGDPDTAEGALASTANYLRAHGWKPGAGYQPGEPNFAAIQAWNASDCLRTDDRDCRQRDRWRRRLRARRQSDAYNSRRRGTICPFTYRPFFCFSISSTVANIESTSRVALDVERAKARICSRHGTLSVLCG